MHNERNFNISFTEMKEILLEFSLSENFTKCFSESPDHLVVFFTSLIFDCVLCPYLVFMHKLFVSAV